MGRHSRLYTASGRIGTAGRGALAQAWNGAGRSSCP